MKDEADSLLRTLTGYQLRRATSAAMPGINTVLGQYGLRRGTYSSLVVITKNPGLNQVQLADILAIERPNLVAIVDELEAKKLVRRRRSKADRRVYWLIPTDKGIEFETIVSKAIRDFDKYLTTGLSVSEIRALQRALHVIENNASQMESLYDVKISSA